MRKRQSAQRFKIGSAVAHKTIGTFLLQKMGQRTALWSCQYLGKLSIQPLFSECLVWWGGGGGGLEGSSVRCKMTGQRMVSKTEDMVT